MHANYLNFGGNIFLFRFKLSCSLLLSLSFGCISIEIHLIIMAKGTGSSSKQFALVRWTEDEKVGVMPISAVVKDYTPYVGAIVKMRWRGKKLYEAEILKISGKLSSIASLQYFTDVQL